MNACLDIVELIENNPITRLSGTYQNKLLIKIKNNFTDSEQQLFVASFYCFLNYNQRKYRDMYFEICAPNITVDGCNNIITIFSLTNNSLIFIYKFNFFFS